MTELLASALVISVLAGLSTTALIVVWPRRPHVDEWITHRRSFAHAAAVARTGSGQRDLSPSRHRARLDRLVKLSYADRSLLELAGVGVPTAPEAMIRRLTWLAGAGAVAGVVISTALALLSGATWLALAAPVVGLIAGVGLPVAQLASWRAGARRVRTDIQRNLPRLLTGARVLLESGAGTAEGALAAAATTYSDPAAEILREALRLKEVRRLDLEVALDSIAERYSLQDLRRLADSIRIGHRYGTGMSALLADFADTAREGWHARYRERITRAPVLMTMPALIFFVLPLLVLVMYLVFAPLMGTLARL